MSIFEFSKHPEEDCKRYKALGWWLGTIIGDLIHKIADAQPAREALIDDRVRLTYGELRERVNRLAAGWIRLGIQKADTVLLQLPNWAEFVYSYFALQQIGAIPVLLISGYRQLEINHLCQLTEAKAWIVPDIYRNVDYGSFVGEIRRANPQLAHVVSVRAERASANFTARLEQLMEKELNSDDKQSIASRRPAPADIAHILPSGGTTGLPKAIPRTHNDYICNVEYLHRAGEMGPNDVALIVVPVGHNLALLNVVGAMFVGYKLVLLDSTRPADICNAIQAEKATYVPTVPSLVKRVLEFDVLDEHDLTSLKKISAGGEPGTPELVRKTREKLGASYISEFGMSEGPLCRSRLDDDLEAICNSVGKPTCPYDQFKILDEQGKELPPKVDGELAAKGPGIFAGYMKNPGENKKVFTADGFFRTGDLARIDGSGNIKITGRIKDLIITGGENISPAQVEELLLSHPGVADAAVIGMPDKDLGERVCAYIQSARRANPDPEEIKAFMRSRGASKFLIPERFEFVDTLPTTGAGKHDKKALRDDIKRKLEREL